VPDGCAYAKFAGCSVEKPRWLSRVLRAVGLIGEGEIGVRGSGDFMLRVLVVFVGRARESLGLAARASILDDEFAG